MADRIILVFILVLTGVYFWATSQIPTLEIGDPLGPKAFPRLLGAGMLLTAVMLLAEIIKERKTAPSTEVPAPGERSQWRVIIAVTLGTFVFFVSFEFLGYMISVTAYLLAMTYFFNKNGRWMTNGLTSVIYGVGSYFIFTQALGVNLPRGLLPF
jgi:putative tricarboxylic transport membrane protein